MNTLFSNTIRTILLFGVLLGLGLSLDVQADIERQWQFKVFLDDREIGYHKVSLIPEEEGRRVSVEARFKVKFLFITAYRYEHKTEELWEGSCLTDIQSRTDDNGKKLFVRASSASNDFELVTHDGMQQLDGCVRSFAYWAPELLKTQRLLNTQTGEYQEVEVLELGDNPIEIEGEMVDARQYRLLIEDFSIDLWYTPDMDWLALQSITEGGHRLRYLPTSRVF